MIKNLSDSERDAIQAYFSADRISVASDGFVYYRVAYQWFQAGTREEMRALADRLKTEADYVAKYPNS